MNNKERIERAFNLEEVDRIPVVEFGIDPTIIAKIHKIPEYVTTFSHLFKFLPAFIKNTFSPIAIKRGQEVIISAAEKIGLDGISLYIAPNITWMSKDEFKTELGDLVKINYEKIFEPPGVKGTIGAYSIGSCIKTPEEFLELDFSPENEHGVSMAIGIVKNHPNIVLIPTLLSFQNLMDVLGYDKLIEVMGSKPKIAKKMMKKIERFNIEAIKILNEEGFNFFMRPDDFGSTQGLIYPTKELKKIILPSFKKLVSTAHKIGAYIILHSCGNINDIMDSISECPVNSDRFKNNNFQFIQIIR